MVAAKLEMGRKKAENFKSKVQKQQPEHPSMRWVIRGSRPVVKLQKCIVLSIWAKIVKRDVFCRNA